MGEDCQKKSFEAIEKKKATGESNDEYKHMVNGKLQVLGRPARRTLGLSDQGGRKGDVRVGSTTPKTIPSNEQA